MGSFEEAAVWSGDSIYLVYVFLKVVKGKIKYLRKAVGYFAVLFLYKIMMPEKLLICNLRTSILTLAPTLGYFWGLLK